MHKNDFNFNSKKFNDWKINKKIESKGNINTYRLMKTVKGKETFSLLKVVTVPNESLVEYIKKNETSIKDKNLDVYFEDLVKSIEEYLKKLVKLAENKNVLKLINYDIVKNKTNLNWEVYIQLEDLKLFKDSYDIKKLTNEEIVRIGLKLCKTIELCHIQGIVHGNIKDDSIYINEYGEYKLGNFDFEYETKNIIN
ncbi:MAG: hypothetical protein ABF289_15090, partial [Clostridiales bacterium]